MTTNTPKTTATPEKKIFDMAMLKMAPSAKVELRHPITNEGTGNFLILASRDSDTFKAAMRDRHTARVATAKLTGDLVPTPEQTREENFELLSRCVLGFAPVVMNGVELEYTSANIRILLEDYVWAYEQVDTEVANRGNFLRS